MKRYIYNLFYAVVVGLFCYVVDMILLILSCLEVKEPLSLLLHMIVVSILVVVIFCVMSINCTLWDTVFRYVIAILSYFVIIGINGSIGTVRYIYSIFETDISMNLGGTIMVLMIIILVGAIVVIIKAFGKLVELINP